MSPQRGNCGMDDFLDWWQGPEGASAGIHLVANFAKPWPTRVCRPKRTASLVDDGMQLVAEPGVLERGLHRRDSSGQNWCVVADSSCPFRGDRAVGRLA